MLLYKGVAPHAIARLRVGDRFEGSTIVNIRKYDNVISITVSNGDMYNAHKKSPVALNVFIHRKADWEKRKAREGKNTRGQREKQGP
jgi:hypothetical protein